MIDKLFREKYRNYDVSDSDIESFIITIKRFENFREKDISQCTVEDIKEYMNYLIDINENTYNNVIHFTRYFYYIGKNDEYIHMTKYFNSIGVLENIIERISLFETKELQENIMKELRLPPFGTDTEDLPEYTKEFMDIITKHLPKTSCNKILAGNNHNIPKTSFDKEKEYYLNASSLSEYLKERHVRKVEELQYHLDNNLVWFEQIITKEGIDYVKSNQEILSGVLKEDKLYVTKIPYDITNFLMETDETLKRYYACHCSFVRENILNENHDIPKEWCYCSGGFAKHPFEQILGADLDIQLLNTPLDGDMVCRFVIDLKGVNYK